jgi:mannonate dehydratase
MNNFVLVRLETNQPGLYGWGDATMTGTELAVKAMLEEHLFPALNGRDPMRIEDAWQTLFFLPYYRGGTAHMAAISGVDMALWDIKGKAAGMPVYDLLGGKSRDRLMVYQHASGRGIEQVEESARALMEKGLKAIRVQVASPKQKTTYGVRDRSKEELAAAEAAYAAGAPRVETWEMCLPRYHAQALRSPAQQAGWRDRIAARRSRASAAQGRRVACEGARALSAVFLRGPLAARAPRQLPPHSPTVGDRNLDG